MKTIIEKIRKLYDGNGLICKPQNGVCYLGDNRILLNADFVLLLRKCGKLRTIDTVYTNKAIDRLWAVVNGKKIKGLLTRQPGQPYGTDKAAGEVEQHDDRIGASCINKETARAEFWYGLKHLWHYDARSFSENKKTFGFWGAIKEHLRCTLQPYQWGMITLNAWGFCDPLAYIHIIICILIETIPGLKKWDYTSGKLIHWRFSEAQNGSLNSMLYRKLMSLRDEDWVITIFTGYFGQAYPEIVELVKNIYKKQ